MRMSCQCRIMLKATSNMLSKIYITTPNLKLNKVHFLQLSEKLHCKLLFPSSNNFIPKWDLVYQSPMSKYCSYKASQYPPRNTSNLVKAMNMNGHSRNSYNSLYPLLGISIFGFEFNKDEEEEETEESKLILIVKRGIIAMQNDELDIAERLFHLALKSAQELKYEEGITYIYDLMANLALQQEYFVKAEKLYTDVMKRLIAGGMAEDHNALVEISLKLASIFASTDQADKALSGFHFCIGTQDKKIKKHGAENLDEDTLILWAMSLDWYARFLIRLGEYEHAKHNFIKAYDMCVKVNGSLNGQAAVLLNDIASVCSLMKEYDDAIDYLTRAIDIAKETDNADLPAFYINLGAIQMERKLFDEASILCEKGAYLSRKLDDAETLQEAKSCIAQIKELKKSNISH